MGDQKMSELRRLEMQSELRETDGDLGQNNKRKERAGTDAGEQKEKLCGFNPLHLKKQKFIHADDLQNETSEAVPNTEEANNERKEPTEIKKNGEGSEEMDPELVRIMEELDDCFPAFEYEFHEQDFLPWESVGESLRHHHQFLLSPQESSNKNVAAQPQMQTHGPSDELRMLDGISLADLRNDLQEGQGSTSDLDKEENQERLDEIYFDLANVLKP